ncbi:alpha/beta fold hydrolase [Bacterioplanoides sp.]|uniref:alpha/beta fold hydrolase n=1 Tax=Bacterioplanoides sp. TaxID=2066072 RepID=UPI003B00C575
MTQAAADIILLRGLIRSRFHWQDFPQQLQHAFPEHRILTPELAGNGERFQENTPASIRAMMLDIRQQVTLDQSQAKTKHPAVIIAVSMGAMIATEWAHHFPQEVQQLHLINTSAGQFSRPWQRMQAAAFLSLLPAITDKKRLEQKIIDWTINIQKDAQLTQRWQDFSQQHPLSLRNAVTQLLAASRYRGQSHAPINHCYFYHSQGDRLVNPNCTAAIAQHWNKPLERHGFAGHDLSMDDSPWLIDKLRENILSRSEVFS